MVSSLSRLTGMSSSGPYQKPGAEEDKSSISQGPGSLHGRGHPADLLTHPVLGHKQKTNFRCV